MRTSLVLIVGFLCMIGCSPETHHTPSDQTSANRITTIKYDFEGSETVGTFEIVGTDVKGITLGDLSQELIKHQGQHSGATYEVYAKSKCHPELSDKIIATIRGSGVTLEHCWVPQNDVDSQGFPGKYGVGYVDILKQ